MNEIKIKLVILSSLYLASAHTQQLETYTSFVEKDTGIFWAAEFNKIINLTPINKQQSLKKWYLDKIKNTYATAYFFDSTQKTVFSFQYSRPHFKSQEWLNGLIIESPPYKNPKEWYFVDSTLNKNDYDRYKYRVSDNELSSDSCCGCDEADAFLVKQIVYYKNKQFHLQNIFISPLCARGDGSAFAKWSPLCNVAYNSTNEKPPKKGDLVFLNTDEVEYDFSSPGFFTPLGFDKNIFKIIMSDLEKGKLKAVDFLTGAVVPPGKLLSWKAPVDTTIVLDNKKNATYKLVARLHQIKDLSRFRITMKLYFDFKNEKLYAIPQTVVIIRTIYSQDGYKIGYAPFVKLTLGK